MPHCLFLQPLFFCRYGNSDLFKKAEVAQLTCILFNLQMLWSIVDAVDLYRTFVVVFDNGHGRQARFLSGYRVFAWGGALLPPTIAMLTDRDNFITPAHSSQPDWNTASSEHALCWINMSSDLKWAFLIPIFIVITIGCTSIILIVRAIRQSTSHPAFRSGLYTAKLVLGISAVTGVTWIFAVLVVLFSDVAFSYLFAIFASTQGAALVYYHVCRDVSTLSSTLCIETVTQDRTFAGDAKSTLARPVASLVPELVFFEEYEAQPQVQIPQSRPKG